MGYGAQRPHGGNQFGKRNTVAVCRGDRAHDVLDVCRADELCGKFLPLVAVDEREGRARGVHRDVGGKVVRIRAQPVGHGGAVRRVFGDGLARQIHIENAVCGQRAGKLVFCPDDVFHAAEALEVLLADRGHNAARRVDDVAQLPDVADVFGAHLADEDLVRCAERRADGLDHAHRRVVAFGRHQRVVAHREQVREEVFDRGLAERAGDADDLQVLAGREYLFHIIRVVPPHRRLDGRIDLVGRRDEEGQRKGRDAEKYKFTGSAEQGGKQQKKENKQPERYEQAAEPRGEDQRLFRLFLQGKRREDEQKQCKKSVCICRMTCGNEAADDCADKREKRRNHARFVCLHPAPLHPRGVGIELEHVQKITRLEIQVCGKRAERDRMQRMGESRDRVHGKTSVIVQRKRRARGKRAPGHRQRRSDCRRGRRQAPRRGSHAPSASRRQAAWRRRAPPRTAGSAR